MSGLKQAHTVYRIYDVADRLIYIGCTHDIGARMQVHASSWSNPASAAINLRMNRMTETEYPDKESARAAERQAIFDEAPILNLHHQRERLTPAYRRAHIEAYIELTRPEPDAATLAWFEAAS